MFLVPTGDGLRSARGLEHRSGVHTLPTVAAFLDRAGMTPWDVSCLHWSACGICAHSVPGPRPPARQLSDLIPQLGSSLSPCDAEGRHCCCSRRIGGRA